MSKEYECPCEFCTVSRKYKEIKEKRDFDALLKLFDEALDNWLHTSEDLSYHECIADGSWPTSVEILENWLVEAKAKQNPPQD